MLPEVLTTDESLRSPVSMLCDVSSLHIDMCFVVRAMKRDIPVVVIGLGRGRGISDIPPICENTPDYVAACMDLTEVEEEYRYSPYNLAIILHNLYRRPRALLIGIAVDPSYT
ncbi:hypothetical protein CFIO01_00708 [Colletotrichum fioriniae PJ7]|uniref:Uncharacterized protein n=1 Tax=Colletotrichum fioriniae PJ7 TaxID=1445577 RepID=A0A010RSQ6_9PEZI|nr:hypothetical protein CFIO01_00708 [Colletotrichum fioriniae PJ7]